MMGIITLSSSCPAWVAMAMVWSLPITWKQTMLSISAITGFTFPGMMDEPGCTAGRTISARPVVGPELSRRRSLAMRVRVSARVRSAPDRWAKSAALCIDSNRLPEERKSIPVSAEILATMAA